MLKMNWIILICNTFNGGKLSQNTKYIIMSTCRVLRFDQRVKFNYLKYFYSVSNFHQINYVLPKLVSVKKIDRLKA